MAEIIIAENVKTRRATASGRGLPEAPDKAPLLPFLLSLRWLPGTPEIQWNPREKGSRGERRWRRSWRGHDSISNMTVGELSSLEPWLALSGGWFKAELPD